MSNKTSHQRDPLKTWLSGSRSALV